jgi:predicted helicase
VIKENEQDSKMYGRSESGRMLAEMQINYDTVPAYLGVTVTGTESIFYTEEKMRFPKKDQKDTIIYNCRITISNIPARAYEYGVNGKSAIEWIMERYKGATHEESGIRNIPYDRADEVGNPRYFCLTTLTGSPHPDRVTPP